jgi:hypothetical protein
MNRRALASSLSLILVAAGCTTTTTVISSAARDSGAVDEPDAGTTEETQMDAAPPEDVSTKAPLACGARKVSGPLLPVQAMASFPPAGLGDSGGQVADGHYAATGFKRYGSSSKVADHAADLWIDGARYEWEEDDQNTGIWTSAGTIGFDSTKGVVKMVHDCAKYSAPPLAYTASGSELTLRLDDGQGHTFLYMMTKVP